MTPQSGRDLKTLDARQADAIAELASIVELLASSNHPGADASALIVLRRIRDIAGGAPLHEATEDTVRRIVFLARTIAGTTDA